MSMGTASLLGGRPVFQGGQVPNSTGFGTDAIANMAIVIASTPTSPAGSTYGIYNAVTAPVEATTVLYGIYSNIRTTAAVFTLPRMNHFYAGPPNIGATSTVTIQEGFSVAPGMTGASTNNFGFRGSLAVDASKNFNLYMDGTAPNYLAGYTGIGIAASSTSALTLAASTTGVASLRVPHGAAPSSPVDGDIWTTASGLYVRINGATVGPLS